MIVDHGYPRITFDKSTTKVCCPSTADQYFAVQFAFPDAGAAEIVVCDVWINM